MKRHHFIIIFLSMALILSISLLWFLFVRARQYYLQLNETRLDPLGLSNYPAHTAQPSLPDITTLVFFGDSRAAQWPSPPDMPKFEIINRGIGGQTSAQTWLRFEAHLQPLQPDIVIVQTGINDLKTIPLFPDRKATIINDVKENIRQIVDHSVANGATVILTTIFPTAEVPLERSLFWSPEVSQAVREVNAYIHTLAASQVIIFDAYAILAHNELTWPEYSYDLLHLNEAGYEALNRELKPVLITLP